jgi:hypothetical protein
VIGVDVFNPISFWNRAEKGRVGWDAEIMDFLRS